MFPHGPQVLTLLLCRYKVNETNSDSEVTWSLFIKHLLCARPCNRLQGNSNEEAHLIPVLMELVYLMREREK